jgi:hypothetical protein
VANLADPAIGDQLVRRLDDRAEVPAIGQDDLGVIRVGRRKQGAGIGGAGRHRLFDQRWQSAR